MKSIRIISIALLLVVSIGCQQTEKGDESKEPNKTVAENKNDIKDIDIETLKLGLVHTFNFYLFR